jgi:hypothetical protein
VGRSGGSTRSSDEWWVGKSGICRGSSDECVGIVVGGWKEG